MSGEEVIERYMRRFDRAVGAEPAALTELVESFSDDAVVNFDGTVMAIAGTEYYTINDQGLITNLVNEPCGLPLTPGTDEATSG